MSVFKKKAVPKVKTGEEQFLGQFDTLSKALPKLLDIQGKYAPQFAQAQMELAPQLRAAQKAMNPEYFGALEQLGQALASRGDLTSLNQSPEILDALRQDVRAGQAARGTALSPISSITEAQRTLASRIAERDKWLGLAQALGGQVPYNAISSQTYDLGSVGTPNISSLTSLQQQSNQLAFSAWDRQQAERARVYAAYGSVIPGVAGNPFRSSALGFGYNVQDPTEQYAAMFGNLMGGGLGGGLGSSGMSGLSSTNNLSGFGSSGALSGTDLSALFA